MAFRLIRQRREQRRVAKLEEIFQVREIKIINIKLKLYTQDRDKNQTGKISLDQLTDIFRIYQVCFSESDKAVSTIKCRKSFDYICRRRIGIVQCAYSSN